jgi:hypothetical protein
MSAPWSNSRKDLTDPPDILDALAPRLRLSAISAKASEPP